MGILAKLGIVLLLFTAAAVGQADQQATDQKAKTAPGSQPQMTINPSSYSVSVGGTVHFTAAVAGAADGKVIWSVSGPGCADSACGTISMDGVFTAPLDLPVPPTVNVTATLDTGASAAAVVTLTERVFKAGEGVIPPRPIFAPDPEYSKQAQKAKYEGTCVLYMVVGSDGKPRDIKVARTLGLGLDEKAIEAVQKWRFEPAMKDGKPVASQVNVEVRFRLYKGPPPRN